MKKHLYSPGKLYRKILIFVILIVIIATSWRLFERIKDNKQENKPEVVLWAWERPENLRFLKNTGAGIAYLAGSIEFKNLLIKTTPRLQPLSVDNRTPMTAVIRIDNIEHRDANFTENEFTTISEFIVRMCSTNSKVTHCQIDFDALETERKFYEFLLVDVRKKLPEQTTLSITALVSWCHSGSWIDELPIDEAVPMFFQLGVDEYVVRNDMTSTSFMQSNMCQKSVGISVDEPLPDAKYLKDRTIYIFNSKSWTQKDYQRIIETIIRKLSA